MPPRFAYWTIVAGGLPTAFRAAEREELLPTFKRIQARHPDAEMKYFARGKLWTSDEEARRAAEARRRGRVETPTRGRDWRPGGEHRDPRQRFKDLKKERNLEWRKQRFERRRAPDAKSASARPPSAPAWRGRPPREKPAGDPLRRQTARPKPASSPRGPHGPRQPSVGGERGRFTKDRKRRP